MIPFSYLRHRIGDQVYSGLLQKFSLDGYRAFTDSAIHIAWVICQSDVLDHITSLECLAHAFHFEILGHVNIITVLEYVSVAVFCLHGVKNVNYPDTKKRV